MNITDEGAKKVKRWQNALENMEHTKNAVTKAEVVLSNAITELGNWIWPDDGKSDEKFCVWYGNGLLEVSKDRHGDFRIKIRSKGTSLGKGAVR